MYACTLDQLGVVYELYVNICTHDIMYCECMEQFRFYLHNCLIVLSFILSYLLLFREYVQSLIKYSVQLPRECVEDSHLSIT